MLHGTLPKVLSLFSDVFWLWIVELLILSFFCQYHFELKRTAITHLFALFGSQTFGIVWQIQEQRKRIIWQKYQKHRDSRATVKLWQDMDIGQGQTLFLFGAYVVIGVVFYQLVVFWTVARARCLVREEWLYWRSHQLFVLSSLSSSDQESESMWLRSSNKMT